MNNILVSQRPDPFASHLDRPEAALECVGLSSGLFSFPKEAVSLQELSCLQEQFGGKCLNDTGSCR